MEIQRTQSPAFQAKFLKTDALQQVVDYAVEKNKFAKLNTARKNIENNDFFHKVALEIDENTKSGKPLFVFTTYKPIYEMKDGTLNKTYKVITGTQSAQKSNYIKELYELIIKMGNNAPHNNVYRRFIKGE